MKDISSNLKVKTQYLLLKFGQSQKYKINFTGLDTGNERINHK